MLINCPVNHDFGHTASICDMSIPIPAADSTNGIATRTRIHLLIAVKKNGNRLSLSLVYFSYADGCHFFLLFSSLSLSLFLFYRLSYMFFLSVFLDRQPSSLPPPPHFLFPATVPHTTTEWVVAALVVSVGQQLGAAAI